MIICKTVGSVMGQHWQEQIPNPSKFQQRTSKNNFFFRRYYVTCQIANICKHFNAPEHFSVHRDSKMIAKIGMISSEKNLTLHKDEILTIVSCTNERFRECRIHSSAVKDS